MASTTTQMHDALLESGSACVRNAQECVDAGDPELAGRWFGAAGCAFKALDELVEIEEAPELGETVEFDAITVAQAIGEAPPPPPPVKTFDIVRVAGHASLVRRS